jgi:hypothetical protein
MSQLFLEHRKQAALDHSPAYHMLLPRTHAREYSILMSLNYSPMPFFLGLSREYSILMSLNYSPMPFFLGLSREYSILMSLNYSPMPFFLGLAAGSLSPVGVSSGFRV